MTGPGKSSGFTLFDEQSTLDREAAEKAVDERLSETGTDAEREAEQVWRDLQDDRK